MSRRTQLLPWLYGLEGMGEREEVKVADVVTNLGPRQLGKDGKGEPCLVYVSRVQGMPGRQWIGPAVSHFVMACAVLLELAAEGVKSYPVGLIQVCEQLGHHSMEQTNPLMGWNEAMLAKWCQEDPENVQRVNSARRALQRMQG